MDLSKTRCQKPTRDGFTMEMSLLGEPGTMPVRPLIRHDFRVAVICALSLEAEMVEMMFDRHWSHEGVALGKAAGDHNVYSLGLIGKHNVVLAFMPRTGSNSAAAAASGLRFSFPNLDLAVLVGICGASPIHPETGKEVILGDCIIGTDVVQYDFGRQYPNEFRRKDSTSGGPVDARPEMRSLIERLKTTRNQRYMATRLAHHLNRLQDQEPGLGVQYPGSHRDRLFQADYLHTHHDLKRCISCVDEIGACVKDCDTLRCDDAFLVQRKRLISEIRTTPSSVPPEIHFGRFGSANTVMRSGIDRDRLTKQEQFAAFEMEGSGVCGLLPTIVIKAVCDYADSHKNKEWQKYAAAVSASALKAVLENIDLPDRELFVSEAMSTSWHRSLGEPKLFHASSTMIRTIDGSSGQGKSRIQFSRTLDSIPSTSREHYTNAETWLYDQTVYKNWSTKSGSILWLYGIPWCGKTFLCSKILQQIRTNSMRPVLFFSFEAGNERQSSCCLLQTVLWQLYESSPTRYRDLGQVLSKYMQNGLLLSLQYLSQTTAQMLSSIGPVYLIIDAIDKCRDRNQLLNVLNVLVSECGLSVFATSRQRFATEVLARDYLASNSILAVDPVVVGLDIQEYVHYNLQDKDRFHRWSLRPTMLQEIENSLVEKSDGCFKLAVAYLEKIETCLDSRMLTASLNEIPEPLTDAYSAMSASITNQFIPYAGKLLQLLLYWPQPITLVEAVDYLAIQPEITPSFNAESRMPEPLDVAMIYGDLLAITTVVKPITRESAYVQLAHPSIQQFLRSETVPASLQRYLKINRAQEDLSMAAIAYLNSVINILADCINTGKALLLGQDTGFKDFPFLKTALWIAWQSSCQYDTQQRKALVDSLQNQSSALMQVMHDLAMEQTNHKHTASTLHAGRKLLYCAQDSVWDDLLEARSNAIKIKKLTVDLLSFLFSDVDLVALESYSRDARGKRWTILPTSDNRLDCRELAQRAMKSKNMLIPTRQRCVRRPSTLTQLERLLTNKAFGMMTWVSAVVTMLEEQRLIRPFVQSTEPPTTMQMASLDNGNSIMQIQGY